MGPRAPRCAPSVRSVARLDQPSGQMADLRYLWCASESFPYACRASSKVVSLPSSGPVMFALDAGVVDGSVLLVLTVSVRRCCISFITIIDTIP
eukprot:94543-Rhodomonas_salina.4